MESVANGIAGSTAGIMSLCLLYPLDNVRTHMQVHAHKKKQGYEAIEDDDTNMDTDEYDTILNCARSIIKKDGLGALYNGLSAGIVGITISNAVYFFWYDVFKNAVLSYQGRYQTFKKQSVSPLQNVAVAMAAGVVNVFVTAPVWLVNARIKVSGNSITDTCQRIYKDGGLKAFYKGLLPSLILCSNPAIQFATYEQLSRMYFLYRRKVSGRTTRALSAVETLFLAAIAKAVATILTYPYQVVKERFLVKSMAYKYNGILDAVKTMYNEEGLGAFFQGIKAKMTQTITNAAFLFMIYEKIFAFAMRFVQAIQKRRLARVAAKAAAKLS